MATRSCTNPSPQNGGATCSGSATQSEACNTQACTPMAQIYSDYNYGGQSMTLGTGSYTQAALQNSNPAFATIGSFKLVNGAKLRYVNAATTDGGIVADNVPNTGGWNIGMAFIDVFVGAEPPPPKPVSTSAPTPTSAGPTFVTSSWNPSSATEPYATVFSDYNYSGIGTKLKVGAYDRVALQVIHAAFGTIGSFKLANGATLKYENQTRTDGATVNFDVPTTGGWNTGMYYITVGAPSSPAAGVTVVQYNWAGNPLTSNANCGASYGNTACAPGLCCSPSGWCGTGAGYCTDATGQFDGQTPANVLNTASDKYAILFSGPFYTGSIRQLKVGTYTRSDLTSVDSAFNNIGSFQVFNGATLRYENSDKSDGGTVNFDVPNTGDWIGGIHYVTIA